MSRAARAYVADVNRKAPPRWNGSAAKPATRAFTLVANRQIAVQTDKKAQVAIDAAAFDAMCAIGKRLKPPPLPENMPSVRSAGAREVRRDRRELQAPVMHWTGEGWRL